MTTSVPSAGDRSNATPPTSSTGLMSPLMRKRARSPMHIKLQELQRGGEDVELDNVRTQKRYLTEMMAADMSKLRVNQQHPTPTTSSTSRPIFMLPAICLPPSPTPPSAFLMLGGAKLPDFMECDECPAAASTGYIAAYCPGTASSGDQHSTSPVCLPAGSTTAVARSMSSPSLQQLQREAHESPSSPTDNKLSIDLRKAALIRSLLHKAHCDPAGRRVPPLPSPPQQRQGDEEPGVGQGQGSASENNSEERTAMASAAAPPTAHLPSPAAEEAPGREPGGDSANCLQLTPLSARICPDLLTTHARGH